MLMGGDVAPPPRIPEQKEFGQIRGRTVSVAVRQGITSLGAMAWHVMEDSSWHRAAGLMLCPVPLSLTVVTGGKPDVFCWILPKRCLPLPLTHCSELGVSLVSTYSDQEWVWCLPTVTTSAGFSLGGPSALGRNTGSIS